jgi:F-type H+-transporting ATPase subunit b
MLELNLNEIIWTIVNLVILYLLLKKFLFRPVTAMIEQRQQEIEHNMAAATDQRIKAEAMLEEYGARLENANQEAASLLAHAKTRAEKESQLIVKQAETSAKRLAETTEAQLESERLAMLAGVRKEVATLALLAATKVSSKEFSEADDEAFLESFLAEVGERT